jgi:hypothetical protein
MKLYFDHVLGKQKDEDLVYSLVSATFPPEEWYYAFDNGWAPTPEWYPSNFNTAHSFIWYQSRQTRIRVKDYVSNKKTKKLAKTSNIVCRSSNCLLEDINTIFNIYTSYCEAKGFGDAITAPEELLNYFTSEGPVVLFHFYLDNQLIGISKISDWDSVLFSEFFWWDYKDPSLSLGKLSFYLELEYAKSTGADFLYTGLGYNSESIYKSLKKGFEFWTGREWSSNAQLYQELCLKDDEITTLHELSAYQYAYLKRVNA